MAIAAAGDRILVTFYGGLIGQRLMNTFMYGISTITGTPSQADLMTAVHAQLNGATGLIPKFLACCPTNYTLNKVWLQIVAPGRFAKYQRDPLPAVGTLDQPTSVTNTAVVITRRGDVGNRKNVSTLHVPGTVHGDYIEDGFITGALKDRLIILCNQMKANIVTTGVVANMFPVINNGPGAADFTPITDVFPQDSVRVMRRRTVGLGI